MGVYFTFKMTYLLHQSNVSLFCFLINVYQYLWENTKSKVLPNFHKFHYCNFFIFNNKITNIICCTHQWNVNNKLWQDRLTSPKALDLYHFRKPTLWLHDLCLEVLAVHGNELHLFLAKVLPLHDRAYIYSRTNVLRDTL